jgi:hypothetical protein
MTTTQREIRHLLLRNGHIPTPVNGKDAFLIGWTKLGVNKEVIDSWGEMGTGTGVVCGKTAAIDLDLLDAEAVSICVAIVREMFPGVILERTGLAPKVLIPIHTPEPFRKKERKFTARDGRRHKIELLATGQQFVAEGIHPDTKQPYTWKDLSLTKVAVAHLPIVTEARAHDFLDRCTAELKGKLGWLNVSGVAPDSDPTVIPFAPIGERVEQMQYGGEFGINDTLLAYSGEQLRESIPARM